MKPLRTCLTVALLSLGPFSAASATAADDTLSVKDAERLFAAEVLPLLKSKCFACHGDDPKGIKGEFDIRTRAGMLAGGESETAALVPGKPDESPLYQSIRWDELEMPPKENDRLTEAQIALVGKWITSGAPWPNEEAINEYRKQAVGAKGVRAVTSGGLSQEWIDRHYDPEDLWAYLPIARPQAPQVDGHRSDNPIDAFITRTLQAAKLAPANPADKRTLIRRLTFDLTGLPPTPAEIESFLADDSSQAYEKLVDRLLASPHYGEQMARHWLDVVRYADSAGFSNDFARPNAWRYRDYVIRSFNSDKPYQPVEHPRYSALLSRSANAALRTANRHRSAVIAIRGV